MRQLSARGIARGIAMVAAAACVVAACGGSGDDEITAGTASTTEPGSTLPADNTTVPGSTVAATTIVDAATTLPADDPTPPTAATQATTAATDPPPTTEANSTDDDDVDDSALALLESGLYSVPGADIHCLNVNDAAGLAYAFPATGGDLYAICAQPSAADEYRLTIRDASGSTVTDVSVRPTDQFGSPEVAGRTARHLVFQNGSSSRLHGLVFDGSGPAGQFEIPILLPHDRPAGQWQIQFGDVTINHEVLRPCADSSAGTGDPTRIEPGLQFVRQGPVGFDHCRKFPDVAGFAIDDARGLIEEYYERQGVKVQIDVKAGCGAATVAASSQPAGTVNAFAINGKSAFVKLEANLDCPETEQMVGVDFEIVRTLLDSHVANFDEFSWTADEGCVAGSTVSKQDPEPGSFSNEVTISECE